jgi:HK97 family phage major capsid protein
MPSAARLNKQREAQERERILRISAMPAHWGPKMPGGIARAAELAQQAINEDMTEEDARELICSEIRPAQQVPLSTVRGWDGASGTLGMSQREQQSYSIARALKAAVEGDWRDAGFERECHVELEKQGLRSQGVLVPLEALRAPMLTTNPSQAGNLIGTDHLAPNFIDSLRAATFIYELGCTRMDGMQGNVSIPRQASVSSLGWIAENTDLPESAPTFDKVTLSPKSVGAWTSMSRLMATQADPNIENLILSDFRNCLARELDRTALHGTGLSGQPTGILNTPGIGTVALGVNGAALTWNDILALEREILQDNAGSSNMGFVTSVKAKSKLKGTLKNGVSGADYIWTDSPTGDGSGMMSGYRAMSSTTVRSDLAKGTGTGLSAIAFGDWSSLLVATWGALSLEVDPYADFRKGTIAMRVLLFCDMAVRHPESFAAATDVITT